MARKSVVMITITDDLTGKVLEESEVRSYELAFDGIKVGLDLSDTSAKALKALAETGDATLLRGLFVKTRNGKSDGDALKPDRNWLRANGFPNLEDRGKLPAGAADKWAEKVAADAAASESANDDSADDDNE